MTTEMIKFIVMVKKTGGNFEGLGARRFRSAPSIGHHITLDDESGIGQAYEVIAIIHPAEPAETAGDVILRHVGTDVEMRMALNA